MIMALFVLNISANYEDSLYERIIERVVKPEYSQEKNSIALLQASYDLLHPRLVFFDGKGDHLGIRDKFFRSSDIQLLDGGACGTHVHVLARLLQKINIPVRIAQMECKKKYGCHIVLEAYINNKYMVMDPLFNLTFKNKNGTFASFDEVKNNWDYFTAQLPKAYDRMYAYEGVRYTNWDKIPLVMPLAKKILRLFIKDKVEYISIRSYVLNVYKTYFIMLSFLYILLLIITFMVYKRKNETTVHIR
ncbi:hypothetical protein N9522_00695 [Candidatus Thioglobus sp.]|nr:hypothetical protein [Candidatus Thioglobus sp.]